MSDAQITQAVITFALLLAAVLVPWLVGQAVTFIFEGHYEPTHPAAWFIGAGISLIAAIAVSILWGVAGEILKEIR